MHHKQGKEDGLEATSGVNLALAPSRVGALATAALHATVIVALLSYEPARSALLAAAPIMVDWIAAPKLEPEREPPTPPKPKAVAKQPVPQSDERPMLAVPVDAAGPFVAASPPPGTPVATAPAPAAVVPPIFNADYLENPPPPYPALSRRSGEQGRVVLRVLVNPAGTADEVQIRTSSGHVRLDDTARETVKRWKFVPAKRGAEPVPAWVLIPISFRLEG